MTDQTTETDLTFLQNEEINRTFMHLVTPLIRQAVREESAQSGEAITKLVRDELFALRTDIQNKQADFATHQEVTGVGDTIGDKVSTSLLKKVGEWFDNEAQARVRWQEDIARQYEARFAALAPLETVQQAAAAIDTLSTQQTALKASVEAQLTTHDRRLNKIEDLQKAQIESAEKIKTNTERVAGAASSIRATVDKLVERDKKRQDDIDKIQAALRASDDQTAKDIDQIQDDMRRQEVRLIKTEAEFAPISKVAGAVLRLFTTVRGNVLLAVMAAFFFGFQVVNAYLTYQFIQRIPLVSR